MSSRFLDIHRHRILTGDSSEKKGIVFFENFSKFDFLCEKYCCTISLSDKNQNLIQTKLYSWKQIDGKYLHSDCVIVFDMVCRFSKL